MLLELLAVLIINLSETQNDIQIFGNRAVNSAGMSPLNDPDLLDVGVLETEIVFQTTERKKEELRLNLS